MRLVRLAAPWLLALVVLAPGAQAQSDFSPGGRRSRPPGGKPPAAQPRPRPPTARPPDKPPDKPPDDEPPESSGKQPDVDKLIARYTAVLLSRPHETFPLQKLGELYRQRDGKLDKLIEDFEKKAAATGPDQLNAKLALAAVYVYAGKKDSAKKLLEQAVKDKPKLEMPRLLLARLAEEDGDKTGARQHYEAALPLMQKGAEKERITRALMVLCIELKDFDAARKFHEALVKDAQGSLFVKKELGNEFLNRGHYALAEEEFRKIVTAAAGDNRALAPALRDLGKTLAKQRKMKEALEVLTRARRVAGQEAGIGREILELLTEVYREQGKLAELLELLEKEGGRDFDRLATIGTLYEETGQVDKALKTYREALRIDGKHVDVRVKLVHLLQTAGQLDEAIKEYEALIKAAPQSSDFVFELADTLIQRGERNKALKLVEELERRAANEGDILAAVADFYERIEEHDRSVKVLERLANLPAGDPQYLIDLGDRYFQQGDKKKAEATWLRIRTVVQNRATAAATLGEVYLDHDMPNEALDAFREAVKLAPKQKRYKKQLAIALERTATSVSGGHYRYREALRMWEELLAESLDNELLARECRTHVVSLWAILREMPDKIGPLTARLEKKPPDLEAGRLLAEVQRRLNKLKESEKTLRKVVSLAPGDESSLLALERVLVMQRNLGGAIDVLRKLVDVNAKRAREYYQRMAQYAAELYRDDEAIKYAAEAVRLSPDDANGHYKLAQMYRRRQDNERAMNELRKAISKNDRLYRAYFDLAELLISSGKVDEADLFYRKVIRTSRDEEFVMRAARLSMQVNLGKGTLESLERELLPVALGNPQKTVYRRLLVELYGAMTFPLVHRAHLGHGEDAKKARDELAKIGARAVKPLLDALADDKHAQQRIAIEVLAYVQNKGAGPALFNYALSQADHEHRVRAMIAVGALSDPSLLPRYEDLLAPAERGDVSPGDAIAVAAAWGVARMGDRKAEGLLRKLLTSPAPDIRALAAMGLGLTRNRAHADSLAELARSAEAGAIARAAAVQAIGELGDDGHRPLLLALTDAPETEVKLAALLALSRLRDGARTGTVPDDVGPMLSRAILGAEPDMRRTALAAATATVTGDYRRTGAALPVPDGMIAAGEVLRSLAPRGYTKNEQARALAALREPLAKEALAAVATSPERARVVSELTTSKLEGLLGGASGALDGATSRELAGVSEAIAKQSVNGFVALARHPSVDVRKSAVEFLARRREPEAQRALVSVLSDRDPEVCKTALASMGAVNEPETIAAVVALVQKSQSWSIRAHAARALGRIGKLDSAESNTSIDSALRKAAVSDAFALVREAALVSLTQIDRAAALKLLQQVAASDAEPQIRERARELAREAKP